LLENVRRIYGRRGGYCVRAFSAGNEEMRVILALRRAAQ
jgi:hypothetical protein